MQFFEISYAYKFLGGFYLAMAVLHSILFMYNPRRKSILVGSVGMLMVFINFTFTQEAAWWSGAYKINVLTDLVANGALLYFVSYSIIPSANFKRFIQTFGWFYFAGFLLLVINFHLDIFRIPLEIIMRGAIYLVIGSSCVYGLVKKIPNFLLIVLSTLFLPLTHVFFGADLFHLWHGNYPVIRILFLLIGFTTPFIAYSNYLARYVSVTRKNLVKELTINEYLSFEKLQTEKIRELDQLKSRFFANISHEFRTPLTLLLSPIEKRLASAVDTEDIVELSVMQRNASRLLQLVNQLLDLSRLESGSVKLKASKSNIVAFVHRSTQVFYSLAESKQIQYRVDTGLSEIEMYFDSEKLEKMMNNLLGNAFKFTPMGGIIEVRLLRVEPTANFPEGAIEIQVKDNGVGVAADKLEKIFDRFYQVDSSQTREYEGTGIGLAMVKELTELHYGEISVKSELGIGSCFTIRLPGGAAHLSPEEIIEELAIVNIDSNSLLNETNTTPTNKADERKFKTETLLIVEDNADLRYYMRENLPKHYHILESSNGEEAFAIATDEIPDLIISDLMMPKMDGMQLCKKLKANETTSHIPIILLTAKTNIETKIEGLETGADDYIAKPFDMKELQVRIHNLIEIRKNLQAKFARQITLHPKDIQVTSMDDRFLKKVMDVVETNLTDSSFGVEVFAREVAMSQVQLYRKLTALTGYSPNDFIRHIRLQRAADLLKKKAGNVTEVAYQIGFNNLSYFAKCFKEKFGVSPKDFNGKEPLI